MNRKEKRKYAREAQNRAKLQGKPFLLNPPSSEKPFFQGIDPDTNENVYLYHRGSHKSNIQGHYPDYLKRDERPTSFASDSFLAYHPSSSDIYDLSTWPPSGTYWLNSSSESVFPGMVVTPSDGWVAPTSAEHEFYYAIDMDTVDQTRARADCILNDCHDCKSKSLSTYKFPCKECLKLAAIHPYFQPKDAICKFCQQELNRAKLGDSFLPFEKEGLLL